MQTAFLHAHLMGARSAGSHKFPISAAGDQLDITERWHHAPATRRRFAELARGEVLLLHNWTLHRSETNTTDQPRRGFSVCYIDSATTTHQHATGAIPPARTGAVLGTTLPQTATKLHYCAPLTITIAPAVALR